MASKVYTLNATITFAEGVEIKPGLDRLLRMVRSWTEPGYAVRVAANGSGRVVNMVVEIEVANPTPGSHHIAGGMHDALTELSCKSYTVEVA